MRRRNPTFAPPFNPTPYITDMMIYCSIVARVEKDHKPSWIEGSEYDRKCIQAARARYAGRPEVAILFDWYMEHVGSAAAGRIPEKYLHAFSTRDVMIRDESDFFCVEKSPGEDRALKMQFCKEILIRRALRQYTKETSAAESILPVKDLLFAARDRGGITTKELPGFDSVLSALYFIDSLEKEATQNWKGRAWTSFKRHCSEAWWLGYAPPLGEWDEPTTTTMSDLESAWKTFVLHVMAWYFFQKNLTFSLAEEKK